MHLSNRDGVAQQQQRRFLFGCQLHPQTLFYHQKVPTRFRLA